jgi:hypothetical protein
LFVGYFAEFFGGFFVLDLTSRFLVLNVFFLWVFFLIGAKYFGFQKRLKNTCSVEAPKLN